MQHKGRAYCQLSIKTKVNLEANLIHEKRGSTVNHFIEIIAIHHLAGGIVSPCFWGCCLLRKCPRALMLPSSNATSDKWSYNTEVEAYSRPEMDFSIGMKPPHLNGVKATANLMRYTVDLSLRGWWTWNLGNQSRNFRIIFKSWLDVLFNTCSIGRKMKASHMPVCLARITWGPLHVSVIFRLAWEEFCLFKNIFLSGEHCSNEVQSNGGRNIPRNISFAYLYTLRYSYWSVLIAYFHYTATCIIRNVTDWVNVHLDILVNSSTGNFKPWQGKRNLEFFML